MTSYSHFLKRILLEYVEITGRMQTLQKAAKTLRRNLIAQLLYKIKYSISTAYSRTLGVFFQNSDLLPKFHNLKKQEGIAYLHYPQGLFQLCYYDVF